MYIWRVLGLMYETGVTLNPKKCKLFAETVDYLDHIIGPGRLELTQHITYAVNILGIRTTSTDLCSFSAFISYSDSL